MMRTRRAVSRRWILLFLLLGFGIAARAQESGGSAAVVVGDRVVFTLRADVAGITPAERAAIVNRRVERILTDPELKPENLQALERPDGSMVLGLDGFRILEVTPEDAAAEGLTREALAQRWARLLRGALVEVKPIYRPPHEEGVSFLPLLLVSVLAFGVPLLAARFRRFAIPVVVGEILVGILIGQSGLGLVHYDSWLQFLAEFGFAYLMFLSGLEVDLDLLAAGQGGAEGAESRWRRNPAVLAVLIFALSLLLAAGVALGLTAAGLIRHPWMMMLVLSTTSLGMVVPILKERGATATVFGQTLLLAALVADFVTMFLITIVAGWLASGPTLRLFLGLLLIGVFVAALRLGRALTHSPRLQHLLEGLAHATAQVEVRGSLALMLVFVALSEQLGTEVILGAFLAGVLLALFTEREGSDLHHKLEALGFGFFIPIFFIMVGVRFDLEALVATPQGLLLAPLLILGAFAIKVGAALPLRAIASWRETLAGGFLIASRLSLIIAAAEIGVRLGLFTPTLHAAIICVALVTCVGGPIGFQLLMPRKEREGRHALIVGAGEYGLLLAERLRGKGWEVGFLERNAKSADAARAAGFRAWSGDGSDPAVLEEAGIGKVDTVIAASSSTPANEAVCFEAARHGVPCRIALVDKSEPMERLRSQGIMPVTPLLSTVVVLEGMVTHPAVFGMLTDGGGEKQIADAVLSAPEIAGRALREVRWPGDVLILSVQREGEVLVPHGDTVLRSGDVITLIGSDEHVREAIAWISRWWPDV